MSENQSEHTPQYEIPADPRARLIGGFSIAIRFFQVGSILIFLTTLAFWGTLWITSPDMASRVFGMIVQNAAASPQSTLGIAQKVSAILTLTSVPLYFLLAASIANGERAGMLLGLAFTLGSVLFPLWLMLQIGDELSLLGPQMLWIVGIAQVFSALILGIIAFNLLRGIRAQQTDRDAVLASSTHRRFGSFFRSIFGIPGFLKHLGLRGFLAGAAFFVGAAALVQALYPIVFPGLQINQLYQVNRAACMVEPARERLTCFQNAMVEDSLLMPVMAVLVFIVGYAIYRACLWLGRKLSITSMEKLISRDERPPILFLRSFADDQISLHPPGGGPLSKVFRAGRLHGSLDNTLLSEFTEIGPVVALGDPSNSKIPYGAARRYDSHLDWRGTVFSLIEDSANVIIALGETPSVWEEFDEIWARGRGYDTLFIVPPLDAERRTAIFDTAYERLSTKTDLTHTHPSDPPIGFYIKDDALTVLTAPEPTEDHYLVLVRAFKQAQSKRGGASRTRIIANNRYASILLASALGFAAWTGISQLTANLKYDAIPATDTGIVDLIGPGSDAMAAYRRMDIVELEPRKEGGVVAYVRNLGGFPKLLWLSDTLDIEYQTDIAPKYSAINANPLEHTLSQLVVGEDGRACVHMGVKHPIGASSWKWRWQLSCYDAEGDHLWSQASDLTMRDTAFGIAKIGANKVMLIRPLILQVFDEDGVYEPELSEINAFVAPFFIDSDVLHFTKTLPQDTSVTMKRVSPERRSIWELEIQGNYTPGPIRKGPDRTYIFGATDYDIGRESTRGNIALVGRVDETGNLMWETQIRDAIDASLVDLAWHDERILALLHERIKYGHGRTYVASLSPSGELLDLWQTQAIYSREPEGLTITESGEIYVFGSAVNFPPNATSLELMNVERAPWIARLHPETPAE